MEFNQNNQKTKQTTFRNGKPSGIWKYYDTNNNSIIGTEITNPWLKEFLKEEKNINFFSCKVGDRNVIDKKDKFKSILGFETSGHYCFENTMDGIYAAGFFLKILKFNENIINDVLKLKIIYKEEILRCPLKLESEIKSKLKILKKNKNFHLVLRKSMWEPYLKVYLLFNFFSLILPTL